MSLSLSALLPILGLGLGASLVMDACTWVRTKAFGTPALDYALVGRWAGHMARGQFRHDTILTARPVPGERWMGWTLHYATGVAFAAVLVGLWGQAWLCAPTLWPALAVGLGSVVVPFLVMQPAFGFGVAASRSPRPNQARLRSLGTHLSFAIGLYGTAELHAALLCP